MNIHRLSKLILTCLILISTDAPPLALVVRTGAAGQIGVAISWGYFADYLEAHGQKRRNPTIQEVQLWHGQLPFHNFYGGDPGNDAPDRALYLYAASLDAYPPGPPYFLREQIQVNLQHYPGRLVALYSEPNNRSFSAQYATPDVVAVRLIQYVDFVILYCPTCILFGPIYTQPDVAGTDNPFDHYAATLQAIIKLGRLDVVKSLSPGMNFYAQGKSAGAWAWQIQTSLRKMRSISTSYGGRDMAIVPEWGAPRGGISEQTAMAAAIVAILPTLQNESVASYYFASPFAEEGPRVE